MSDQNNDQLSNIEQEMKEKVLKSFADLYQPLAIFLNRLPMNPKLKDFCFMNLDQGKMWAIEAICLMKHSIEESKESDLSSEEKQE